MYVRISPDLAYEMDAITELYSTYTDLCEESEELLKPSIQKALQKLRTQ